MLEYLCCTFNLWKCTDYSLGRIRLVGIGKDWYLENCKWKMHSLSNMFSLRGQQQHMIRGVFLYSSFACELTAFLRRQRKSFFPFIPHTEFMARY